MVSVIPPKNVLPRPTTWRCLLLATGVASLSTGCALQPYVRTEGLQTSLSKKQTEKQQYAGDIGQAIADVDAQRRAYLDALDARTNARNLINGGLIVLTAATVYKGVVNTSDATKGILAKAGAVAGAGYAWGAYMNSPNTEQAYLHAHQSLTCLVLRNRPWLMPVPEYTALYGPETAGAHKPTLAALEAKINEVDQAYEVAIAEAGSAREKLFLKETRDVSQALYRARSTFRSAHSLRVYIDSAGMQLRQEAVSVVSLANQAILKEQPGINMPGSNPLAQMQKISTEFQNIKPQPVSDVVADKGADKAADRPADKPADKPSDKAADGKVPAGPAVVGKAGMPANTKADPKAKATEAPTAQSELGKAADAMDAQLKGLETKLKGLDDAQKAAVVAYAVPEETLKNLAAKKSELYAAMRPVTAVLTRVYALKPYVKAVPDCQGTQAQPLQLMPDDDVVTLAPGDTHDVTISGGAGYPRVTLAGTRGSAELLTTLVDGVAKASVKVPKDMKSGEFSLVVHDGENKQVDQIRFVVKAGGS